MDRPLGPRAPGGGDRNRAFETIFGRPSAVHHQQHQQQGAPYGLQPPPQGPSYNNRAPSPLGYPGYAPSLPPQQQPAQQYRAPYAYAQPPPAQYSQQQQPNAYPGYPPNPAPQRASQYADDFAYDRDQPTTLRSRQSYAQSLPPDQYAPAPSVRHSIQYRAGHSSPPEGIPERGYPPSAGPSNGMTPAQAYQAQVVREDPRRQPGYRGPPPPGAGPPHPPHAYIGSIPEGVLPPQPGNGNANPPRSQSMMHLDASTSSGSQQPREPPLLPPVDGLEPIDFDDVLEGPRMTDRRYPLRQPRDTDLNSLAESLGAAMLDPAPDGPHNQAGRFVQPSPPPPASPSYAGANNHHPSNNRNRLSNDSVQTMPYPYPHPASSSQQRPPNQHHHRRSSTTDGAMRPSNANMASTSTPSFHPSPQSVRALRGPAATKAMPPLPRHSLPASMKSSATATRRNTYVKPIYPALLSRVAEAFQSRIGTAERVKDGLAYKDAFDGREAVTKLAEIIKTTDRNLALLLGRALDAQKFFHDVTYDHRLRDSSGEVYQFRTALPTPFMAGDGEIVENGGGGAGHGQRLALPAPKPNGGATNSLSSSITGDFDNQLLPAVPPPSAPTPTHTPDSAQSPVSFEDNASLGPAPYSTDSHGVDSEQQHAQAQAQVHPSAERPRPSSVTVRGGPTTSPTEAEALDAATAAATAALSDDIPLPSGVFTLLTECYSPTCTRDRLCYSIACPRRLEQQARLNLKVQPVLKRVVSQESLGDLVEPGTLWIHSVSQEVADSVSEKERKRQEAINEVIYTERDFVRDMEYLRDQWIIPLTTRDIIPEARRKDFVTQVFWNVHEIISVNILLRDALTKRQKHRPVVDKIGDIFLEHVQRFEPFVKYGAHQLYGKYEFEKEKNSNPAFAAFVDEVERLPESRKLELNGYLTKPTTRLARYPLLLEVCLKSTEDGNPDKTTLPEVVKIVRGFLERVNLESGRAENRFNLLQLDQQLVFRPGEAEDLRLLDENREMVYKGPLKRSQSDNSDLQLFLFDHALLIVKAKSKHEQFKVHRKPIPLELLLISPTSEDPGTFRPGTQGRPRNTLIAKRNSTGSSNTTRLAGMHPLAPPPSDKPDPKGGFPITFIHLGRKGYSLTLWASTFISRKKWIDSIVKQQEALRERSTIFETWGISAGYFAGMNRVNCAAPLNHGRGIVLGTDDGVYFADLREQNRDPVKMVTLAEVTQVDVLEEYQLLIVLSERAVITFPLDALDPRDPLAGLKRAKRVSSHTSFFKAGMCLGRMLVCVVKASALSTTIKTLEPIDQNLRGKNKPTFKKLLQGGNDTLRVFKEFYIPVESSSIHFLRTKLCVGCTKGFEIVDLETLDAQGLLDPNDTSLDFVQKRENVRPMAIYRVESEFLLCYEDFAFYINKNGWRSRPGWIIHWEGTPTAFALHYPYVLAFEPNFIEVRHVETGLMAQIIPGTTISCLFADTPPSADSAAPHHQQLQMQQVGGGFAPPHIAARQSMYGAPYPPGGGPMHPHGPGIPPPPRYVQRRDPYKRDEIILSMDDRVVGLRRARSDTVSVAPSYTTLPR